MKNKTKPAPTPVPPPVQGNTKFKFPGITIDCSNEPVWVKVLYFLVTIGALITALCLLQNWAMKLLAGGVAVTNLTSIIKSFRDKGG